MEGILDVPEYYLCPISLQMMRDPVTVITGITYDRESIERWLLSGKHRDCPVTKQPLPLELDLTPNHTLRRLIQAWCVEHASDGVERFPTPRPPVDNFQIAAILDEAMIPQTRMSALQRLKSVVLESDRSRRCVQESGAADLLVSIIREQEECSDGDEALAILCSLRLSGEGLLDLLRRNDDLIGTLTPILSQRNDQSQAYALLLLKSLVPVMSSAKTSGLREEFFSGIVKGLQDKVSRQATKAALQILARVCCCKRNKVKAVRAGAVLVLIELLLGETEKRRCEMLLAVLDQLCGCAEGRAEVVAHAAGIAVVSQKILRVSQLASAMSVRILCSVAKLSPSSPVLQEMLQVGAVSKLCLLLQVDCGVRLKDKATEILRLHSRVWMSSPCLAPQLQASYP
ncbi:hypothetical protein BHE74_00044957 [Ensete ventricosum]|nr:hypothetical protein BHE74_00044957 [Ensete ventricosum]